MCRVSSIQGDPAGLCALLAVKWFKGCWRWASDFGYVVINALLFLSGEQTSKSDPYQWGEDTVDNYCVETERRNLLSWRRWKSHCLLLVRALSDAWAVNHRVICRPALLTCVCGEWRTHTRVLRVAHLMQVQERAHIIIVLENMSSATAATLSFNSTKSDDGYFIFPGQKTERFYRLLLKKRKLHEKTTQYAS